MRIRKRRRPKMLYEFHMLKNYPPTNLNRDDTGSPKSCLFGGVQRGRISSQCLKRSWRQSELFSDCVGEIGIRTRKLPELVTAELKCRGVDEETLKIAAQKISAFGNDKGTENKDGRTSQIMFFSKQDIVAVADRVQEAIEEAGSAKNLAKMNAKDWQKKMAGVDVRPVTIDIALFGRMVTSEAFADVEAAMQVAHAISTNAVSQESDFYTAVDDLVNGGRENDAGAGMMGDTDFNSNCYYIYAALDMDQLRKNLEHSPGALSLADGIARCLLETMAFSNPSGKQNSFAGHALPDVVCVEEKERKIPVSYANAFVKPACPTGTKDLVEESADKLAREIDSITKQFGLDVKRRVWFCRKGSVQPPADALKTESFQDLLRLLDGDGN
jgi:CRISPR system Cascade subunit CasC